MATFQVARRSQDGEKPSKLRKKGIVPMALVERSHETVMIQAPEQAFRDALRHRDGHGGLDLQIEGETSARRAIVKLIEQDIMGKGLLHVTFQEVSDEDQVKLDVPVVAIGHPVELANVTLTAVTDHVKLRGRMADLPEHVEVDISGMQPGEHLEAGSIVLPPGVELLSSPDATLFALAINRAVDLEVTPAEEAEAIAESDIPAAVEEEA